MSLARKLAIQIAALVLGLVLLGGASLGGLMALSGYFNDASDRYEQLRHLYEAGDRAAIARALLRSGHADRSAVYQHLQGAMEAMADLPGGEGSPIAAGLREAARIVGSGEPLEQAAPTINRALADVATSADVLKQGIITNRLAATRQLHRTIALIAGLMTVLIAAAVVLGLRQHRSVMRPLAAMDDAVRRIAGGQFDVRVPETGDREFAELAARFNRTVEQLDQLYRDLEQQVTRKSSQLVRSERLAGVGYLAAGVAHEINNPLGIIAGYAESALRRLQSVEPSPTTEKAAQSLRVVCEQAFRCKQITEKLLSMARPGDASRSAVSLGQVAEQVTRIVAGLPQLESRRVEFAARAGDDTTVLGAEGELTQVMLNLVTNAVESVEAGGGRVVVSVERRGSWAVTRVTDNGRGMSEAVLGRVFDPFFSDKPGRGTGLGLAIAHAIVQQHGGRLAAASDGPGRGSTFTLELPAIGAGVTMSEKGGVA